MGDEGESSSQMVVFAVKLIKPRAHLPLSNLFAVSFYFASRVITV